MNRVANAILGGWDVNAIVTMQSGLPIALTRTAINSNLPNSTGQSAKLSSPGINEWFNTSAFTIAPSYTYGNIGPVLPDVRTDWTRTIDSVLVKNFSADVRDHKITAQFRFEVFNLFNTPQFGAPNGGITSQNFGGVTSTATARAIYSLA